MPERGARRKGAGLALVLGQREFFPMEQFVLSFGENAK
jgi:hypothetical protein